jgi:hypothetical protein
MSSLKDICEGISVDPPSEPRERDEAVPQAPIRTLDLTRDISTIQLIRALHIRNKSNFTQIYNIILPTVKNGGHIAFL